MKRIHVFFVFLWLCLNVFSQTNQPCEHDFYVLNEQMLPKPVNTGDKDLDNLLYKKELIKFFREHYRLPSFDAHNSNREDAILEFNQNLKIWYSHYPQAESILGLRSYSDFIKYDASCYPLPPSYNLRMTDEEYEVLFNQWAAHHPDIPKIMNETNEGLQKYEIEMKEFRNKYYKKY